MPKQNIIIDKESARARELEEITKKKPTKIILICRGRGMTIRATRLRETFVETSPDGKARTRKIPAPVINFENGWAEVCEGNRPITPEIIEALEHEPGWGIDFYYHPVCCPEDGNMERAQNIMGSIKGLFSEIETRKEAAKHFDKNAHPDDGVEDPIDPETGKPDPGGAWPN